jgi:hypothetical protein
MPKPTEKEKKEKKTEYRQMGKYKVGDKEYDVEIIAKTTPNAQGGYDTEMHVPVGRLGVTSQKPGG